MKENAKLFLVSIITITLSITGSAVANTMLQANSISYKTSNGDTTDVNSALDSLFDVADINGRLGNTDISSIGDGTVTGAISDIGNKVNVIYNEEDDYIYINGKKWKCAGFLNKVLFSNGTLSSTIGTMSAYAHKVNGDTNSVKEPIFSIGKSGIYIAGFGTSYSGTVYSDKAIDVTDYNYITFTISTHTGYGRVGLVSQKENNFTYITPSGYITGIGTITYDISLLEGEYYIALNANSDVTKYTVSKIELTN